MILCPFCGARGGHNDLCDTRPERRAGLHKHAFDLRRMAEGLAIFGAEGGAYLTRESAKVLEQYVTAMECWLEWIST